MAFLRRTHVKYLSYVLISLFCLLPVKSYATEFTIGSLDATLNTKLTIGAAWRIEDRDKRQLSQANQNLPAGSALGSPTNNTDDGNWNFDQGGTYSKILKGSTELFIGNDKYGLVSGAKYFYDFELKDERRAKDDTGYSRQLIDETLDSAGSDIELMNLYGYMNFDLEHPIAFKIGRQVLSWGAGLFMQGGVNVINPVDLPSARVPGAELKEILLPVNMVSGLFELSNNVSLEAFYQLEWESIEIDPCGTFFSMNDTTADGCGPIILLNVPDSSASNLVASNTFIIPRLEDREASDIGQFGVALHWYLDQLNGSELSMYYLQYHSRLPYFSGAVANPFQTVPTSLLPIPGLPSYFSEYPEDIRLYGLSFTNLTDSGYTMAAEYSFRENLPIQWNTSEVVYGGLLRLHSRHLLQLSEEAGIAPFAFAGTQQKGYDRYKVSQLQLSTTKFFNGVLGANQSTFAAEVGAVYIHDFPSQDTARYGRSASFGNGSFDGLGQTVFPDIDPFSPLNPAAYSCTGDGAAIAANSNPSYCDNKGYTTQFSWGYILAMWLDYQGVFSSININPGLFFSHDVKGNGPDPMGLFVEGRKSLGLTLNTDYMLSRYQASLGYVRYYGGGRDNLVNDRDHITASLSVSF